MKNYMRMLISEKLQEREDKKTSEMNGETREIFISGFKRVNEKYQNEVTK